MSKIKTKSLLRSFIVVPMLATGLTLNAFTASVDQFVTKQTSTEQSAEISPEILKLQKEREEKAAKIDAYYKRYDAPLEGYGMKMVLVAEEHGLDPFLLPAIAMREQGGGRVLPNNCPGKTKNYNTFGWASGKVCFKSFDEAIDTVGMKLGTLSFYKGKSSFAKLQTYNPPSVVHRYAHEVVAIMNTIEAINI